MIKELLNNVCLGLVSKEDLQQLKYSQLRKLAKLLGVKSNKKAKRLIENILLAEKHRIICNKNEAGSDSEYLDENFPEEDKMDSDKQSKESVDGEDLQGMTDNDKIENPKGTVNELCPRRCLRLSPKTEEGSARKNVSKTSVLRRKSMPSSHNEKLERNNSRFSSGRANLLKPQSGKSTPHITNTSRETSKTPRLSKVSTRSSKFFKTPVGFKTDSSHKQQGPKTPISGKAPFVTRTPQSSKFLLKKQGDDDSPRTRLKRKLSIPSRETPTDQSTVTLRSSTVKTPSSTLKNPTKKIKFTVSSVEKPSSKNIVLTPEHTSVKIPLSTAEKPVKKRKLTIESGETPANKSTVVTPRSITVKTRSSVVKNSIKKHSFLNSSSDTNLRELEYENSTDKKESSQVEVKLQSNIPRFMAFASKKGGFQPGRTRTPNFARIHQKAFQKMDSLDDYVQKKKMRSQDITKSSKKTTGRMNEPKVASKSCSVQSVEPSKKKVKRCLEEKENRKKMLRDKRFEFIESPMGTPVKSPQTVERTPFIPSIISVSHMKLNFGSPSFYLQQKEKQSTSKKQKNFRAPVYHFRKATTPVKSITKQNSKHTTFNLKASLSKKLSYRPYTGPVRPLSQFNASTSHGENVAEHCFKHTQRLREKTKTMLQGVRRDRRFELQMKMRGLN
ncbi:uncharacterized protein LOC143222468 [Tachypleus tridentatus]|uniref:uncharacterized protein LOC143222468 n=1 Tax=Tachypleus tridentatus TaxID=6853 RepID=UPI003FD01EE2